MTECAWEGEEGGGRVIRAAHILQMLPEIYVWEQDGGKVLGLSAHTPALSSPAV